MPLRFENSPCVHAPLGLYSHTVCVPEGTELLFISGQVGVRPDGTTSLNHRRAGRPGLRQLVALLEAHNLAPIDIVKLTTLWYPDRMAMLFARRDSNTSAHIVQHLLLLTSPRS
jgi:enamine deaminase RidA (YjgF/YER057c/UK114 family)